MKTTTWSVDPSFFLQFFELVELLPSFQKQPKMAELLVGGCISKDQMCANTLDLENATLEEIEAGLDHEVRTQELEGPACV